MRGSAASSLDGPSITILPVSRRRRDRNGPGRRGRFVRPAESSFPSLLISSMASKMVWTTSGARPSDGSSSSSRRDATSARGPSPAFVVRRRKVSPAFCDSRSFSRGNILKAAPCRRPLLSCSCSDRRPSAGSRALKDSQKRRGLRVTWKYREPPAYELVCR